MFLTTQLAVLLSLATPLALFSLDSLHLGPPVAIATSESGNSPVDVSGDENGFMATWVDGSGSVWTSFSNTRGKTWQLTGIIPSAATGFYSRIARGPLGTLVTWGNQVPGGPTETPSAAFSIDNGHSWQVFPISMVLIGTYDIPICATDGGFLVTFPFPVDGGHYSAVSVFSPDGTTWEGRQTVSVDHINGTFSPTTAYNGSIFMAAWVNNDNTALFNTSESADASVWRSPAPITGAININSEVTLIAVGTGFLATWSDQVGNAYSSYYDTIGTMMWTTPSPIAFNANSTRFPTVLTSGTASGLIATWGGDIWVR